MNRTSDRERRKAGGRSGESLRVARDIRDAFRRLKTSSNAASRERDLAVLRHALGMDLCPYRRVLLMLGELHRMGFQRLRAPAYMYGGGLSWRCPVIPAEPWPSPWRRAGQ